jgi:hypothetical protein
MERSGAASFFSRSSEAKLGAFSQHMEGEGVTRVAFSATFKPEASATAFEPDTIRSGVAVRG